jgi:hypothetical protein
MGCGEYEKEGCNVVHLIPVGHSKLQETRLEIGITEDEGEGTGRKTKGRYSSSLKGFRGEVQDLASNTDLKWEDALHLCCGYSGEIIPMDIEES